MSFSSRSSAVVQSLSRALEGVGSSEAERLSSTARVSVSASDLQVLLMNYNSAGRSAEYWEGCALRLADVQAASGWDAHKKSASKSMRHRMRLILTDCLSMISLQWSESQASLDVKRKDAIAARVEKVLAGIPEEN